MFGRNSCRRLLWLAMVLGAWTLASCQAGDSESTAASEPQVVDPEPTAVLAPAETIPTETAAVTPNSKPMEPEDQGETQEAEPDELAATAGEGNAANADVEFVTATLDAGGSWRFAVTVHHPDTGWEDYADGWDVVTPDGQVLKVDDSDPFTRLLLHPHENEQPFTRSQSGIVVPEGVTVVVVRAHDLVDGFGGQEIEVDLAQEEGPGFEVNRQ